MKTKSSRLDPIASPVRFARV